MENLPWKIITYKGLLQFAELMLFDINELPSFHITNFVRNDCILVSAYIFWGFNYENVKNTYKEKIQSKDAIYHGSATTFGKSAKIEVGS